MRVMVLGGAGDMGAAAVRDLVNIPEVEQVTIADINVKVARNLAATAGQDKARVQMVDATSRDALVGAMRGYDVVAGALGPFFQFERPIVEAALEAGVNYVSICDDHDAIASILPLDTEAEESGQVILSGMGWTPGLSNVLARKGYKMLDRADKVHIYWTGSTGDAVGLTVLLHLVHVFSGKVPSFQGGKQVEVVAGSGHQKIEFPHPLGEVNVFESGHPEPITMPHYFEGIQEVRLKGGLVENHFNRLIRFLARIGVTRSPSGNRIVGELLKTLLPLFPINRKRSFSGVRVDVEGEKGGERLRYSFAAIDNPRRLTSIPLSIGTFMVGRGDIKRRGVFSPEADGAIDPDIFLEELGKRGIIIDEKMEKL